MNITTIFINVCVARRCLQFSCLCLVSLFVLLFAFILFNFCFLFSTTFSIRYVRVFRLNAVCLLLFISLAFLLLLLLLLPLSLLLLLHRKRLESQIPAWQRFIYNQSRFRLVTQPGSESSAASPLSAARSPECSLSLPLSRSLWWSSTFVRSVRAAALFGVVVS